MITHQAEHAFREDLASYIKSKVVVREILNRKHRIEEDRAWALGMDYDRPTKKIEGKKSKWSIRKLINIFIP